MKIFIAGVTGTLGRPAVRLLLSRGHELIGLTRSAERARALTAQGVRAVVGDALDGPGLMARVAEVRPEVVLHLLTALPPGGPTRPRHLAATNELRVAGTRNLLAAAVRAGAARVVAESFVSVYGRAPADRRLTEDEPLPPVQPGPLAESIGALRALEAQLQLARATGGLTTVALRIGFLYGSDVPATQALVRQARAGRLFVPRELTGRGPFVHVDDAARAIVAAVEHPRPSPTYNVVDDEPRSMIEVVSALARAVDAPPPRHVPLWLAGLAAPLMAHFGTSTLMLSNERLKQELDWRPRYPTVDAGLDEVRHVAEVAA